LEPKLILATAVRMPTELVPERIHWYDDDDDHDDDDDDDDDDELLIL
jgi:hypothetical protein